MDSRTASEKRSPRGSWAVERGPRAYRWCRRSTAAVGGSIRFVAGVLIPFEVARHVPTRTRQHANLDGQQSQLHPAGVRAPGIRHPGRRVDRGLREAVTPRVPKATEAPTMVAGAVFLERIPRLRRLRPEGPSRLGNLGAAQLFIAPHRARDDAGSPDPVLPPVSISAAGDAGCGRDSEGIRSRVIGPAPGSRGPRCIRRRSGRSGRLLHGSGDAIPRDRRAGPDDPGPPWTAKGAEEGLSLSSIRLAYPRWPVVRRPSMAGGRLSPPTPLSPLCSETHPPSLAATESR